VSFSKVLVANRGEIALRIVRACREMGIGSVAVYSDADARAPHVREADEAVNIGAPPSSESYLRGDKVIEAAHRAGAQAIHPGYGFLSEREWFARAVREAGLSFIGPPAEAIAAMGSKTAARQLAIGAKVPVVPGTTTALADAAEARRIADERRDRFVDRRRDLDLLRLRGRVDRVERGRDDRRDAPHPRAIQLLDLGAEGGDRGARRA